MKYSRLIAAFVVAGTSIPAVTISCGPSCIDDRCSLKPATPQTTRIDYTAPKKTTTSSPGTVTPGSAAPVVVATAGSGSGAGPSSGLGSGSPAPVVVAAGSGSATKPAAGSGSATPPKPTPPAPTSASWELYSGNQFRMYVVSKGSFAVGAKLAVDFVRMPIKTPFVVTLETLGNGPEAVWNDCPEDKVRCDTAGAKTHAVKKAGLVMLQAGINWAVTAVADEANGTLVTWTNNLSREVLSLRLSK